MPQTPETIPRIGHFYTLLKQGVWGTWIGAGWLLYSVLAAFRSEFLAPTTQDQWQGLKILRVALSLPLAWWAATSLAILLAWLFEASYRLHRSVAKNVLNLTEQNKRLSEQGGVSSDNTLHEAIEIQCGSQEPFIKVQLAANRSATTLLRIKIRNCGDGYLNEVTTRIIDCMPEVCGLGPGPGQTLPLFLGEPINLARGASAFIIFAYWNSSFGGAPTGEPVLRFPGQSGGYGGMLPNIALPTEKEPALIKIECVAPFNCGPSQKTIRIWIDQDRRVVMDAGPAPMAMQSP